MTLDLLRKRVKELSVEIKKAGESGDEALVRKLTKDQDSLRKTISSAKNATMDFDKVLRNLNGSSLNDLNKVYRALNSEIRKLAPGTAEYIAKSNDLNKVKARISELNKGIAQTNSLLSRTTNSFSNFWKSGLAGAASVAGITYFLKNAAKEAAALDDIYSDVIKTTGLTREEVVLLNEDFAKMNTRTSREALNLLARDAGKLGIKGRDNVLQFVKAADMINVALGEDLGEGAIRNIGKMAEVFGLVKKMGIEKSFLSIGSVINALGQDSTAAEQYIVDFTQRLAGVSAQMDMSISDTMGYASAMDQAGIRVEMGATAFQTFIMKMFDDTAKFAKYAKMETKAFSDLLNTDANEAIKRVLRSLHESGGFADLVPIFKDMGTDGARAVSALSSMAEKIDLIDQAQALANDEFVKGTSILNEYSIKNNNAQAQMEKAQKRWKDGILELGKHITPFFTKSINLSASFLQIITSIPKELYIILAVSGSLLIAWKSLNVVKQAWVTIATSGKAITLAWAYAKALLAGNTIQAARALITLKTAASGSVIGVLLTAVAALGVGMYKLFTNTNLVTKAQKDLDAAMTSEKFKATSLFDALERTTEGTKEYNDIMMKLLELYGPVITSMVSEKGELKDIKVARDAVNKSIEESIKLKLREQYTTEILGKYTEKLADIQEDLVKGIMRLGNVSEDVARIKVRNLLETIKDGSVTMTEALNNLLIDNSNFLGPALHEYVKMYEKMTGQISDINKKFYVENEISPVKSDENQTKNTESPALPQNNEDALKKAFEKELKLIDKHEEASKNKLKEMYLNRQLTKEGYEEKMEQSTIDYHIRRLNVYVKYGHDTEQAESQFYDSLISIQDKALKKTSEMAELHKKVMLGWKKELEDQDKVIKEPDLEKILAQAKRKEESLQKQAQDIREKYSTKSRKAQMKIEMDNLNKLLQRKMISEKEYEQAVKDLKLKNAIAIAEGINNILSQASDFINQIKQTELDRLEADKERELAMYGNDADKRAEIENKYEKKKREIQLKFADAEMGVKIAQTIAAGAVAVMQAWAVNPILGGIMAGIIGAVTAAQVETIIAQRNALKNGGASTPSPGNAFTVSEGFYTGGYTGDHPDDHRVVGSVHANEWVAPAKMVRSNPVLFRELDRARLNYVNGLLPAGPGYYSGGFTSSPDTGNDSGGSAMSSVFLQSLLGVMKEVTNELKKPRKNYIVNSEANAVREIEEQIKKEGSR